MFASGAHEFYSSDQPSHLQRYSVLSSTCRDLRMRSTMYTSPSIHVPPTGTAASSMCDSPFRCPRDASCA
eukprot:1069643-Prymnesium_polylepis.1